MKIYAGEKNKEVGIECSEVDVLCNIEELDELINILLQFRENINDYVQNNKKSSKLGITHIHYQDKSKLWNKDDADIVMYVDLDKCSFKD